MTDDTGAIVEAYDTDAYGNTLVFDAAGTGGEWFADDVTQTPAPTNDYIFTGRRYDPETEIYFYRSRYYVPKQGRFISRDSFDYRDGMNLYFYVSDSPTVFVDPGGTAKQFTFKADWEPLYHRPWKLEGVTVQQVPLGKLEWSFDFECDQTKDKKPLLKWKDGAEQFSGTPYFTASTAENIAERYSPMFAAEEVRIFDQDIRVRPIGDDRACVAVTYKGEIALMLKVRSPAPIKGVGSIDQKDFRGSISLRRVAMVCCCCRGDEIDWSSVPTGKRGAPLTGQNVKYGRQPNQHGYFLATPDRATYGQCGETKKFLETFLITTTKSGSRKPAPNPAVPPFYDEPQ